MKKIIFPLILLSAILLGSCTSTPVNEELQNIQENELEIQFVNKGKATTPSKRN